MSLKETFTNIADAIREKLGSEEKMTPAVMPDRIRAIKTESGSGNESSTAGDNDTGNTGSTGSYMAEKDVNFRDYEGMVIRSYSFEEALALTALPEGPKHENLTFQEWNRSLAYVKELAGYGLKTDIYAIFTPADGKTKIKLWIMQEKFKEMWLFACAKGGVLTVDWGDGTIGQMDWTGFKAAKSSSVNRYLHHKYNVLGKYEVSISGTTQVSLNGDLTEVYGNSSASYGNVSPDTQSLLMINAGDASGVELQDAGDAIRSVILGKNVRVCGTAFEGAKLKSLVIPKGTTFVNASGVFCSSRGLPDIGLPTDLTALNGEFNKGPIERVVLPETMTSLYEGFDMARAMEVVIPETVTDLTFAFSFSGESCGSGTLAPNCRFIFLGSQAEVGSYSFPEGCPIYVKDENYDTLKDDENWKTDYFDKGVVHKISELKTEGMNT